MTSSIAILHPLSPSTSFPLSSRNLKFLSKLPLRITKYAFPTLVYSTPKSAPSTEQDILRAVLDSNGRSLPAVRTYENDLARLTVVGAVNFKQALTAAAADGGQVADEYVKSGTPAMVVETVIPSPPDERSTVSTRLFLPARKVKEKSKRLKSSLPKDIPSSTESSNILAMTFRQVVLEQLWNFELLLFTPGTERNMEELENPREQVPASFTVRSSDKRIISLLGEVVCLAALESTERHFLSKSMSRAPTNLFRWFRKSERVSSMDSSVTIFRLLEDEIISVAKSLLENINSGKASYKPSQTKSEYSWWTLSMGSKLEKIGGPEFGTWVSEYVPAYLFQIDSDRLPDLKLEGWKRSAENRWEVLLTHNQMVALANILDMYYEDSYTLPRKQLSCGAVAKPINLFTNKRTSSLLKVFSIALASGFFLVAIGIFGQLCMPYLHGGRKYLGGNHSVQSSEIDFMQHQAIDSTELDDFCFSIVERIKDAFGWAGDIMTEKSVGAWIGELPVFLRSDADSNSGKTPSCSIPIKENGEELKSSAQDIASYQVVLSAEGKIIGFQPTSRVAVNNWASNPLAKELYGGRKLSAGFIEPSVKISCPSNVAVLELLMSLNPDSRFAFARPSIDR
ncbi:uncharacterized protein LOC131315980 isoform X2 [Rhododendron vialii]|uniref:uncharacterized protein LOC131315980 isoform X2 n=1 Tax=Rhododendron vialii TaxID=182163 RepID=UPI00265ECCB8|nr:uncharacterized protein LOC131315980 isoform X2 [Rhododendron vialii]